MASAEHRSSAESEDTLGNTLRGADLNIFARLIYAESSNNADERAAVGSVIYNRIMDGPYQSLEDLARSREFEAVTANDTRAFDRTARVRQHPRKLFVLCGWTNLGPDGSE